MMTPRTELKKTNAPGVRVKPPPTLKAAAAARIYRNERRAKVEFVP
jgi:hypothetical protein